MRINSGFVWEETNLGDRHYWKCSRYSRRQVVSYAFLFVLGNEIWLEEIYTRHPFQRLGFGTELMKYIISSPPKRKRWIRLNIQPFGTRTLNREKLEVFYRKLGFRATKKRRHGSQIWELDTWK